MERETQAIGNRLPPRKTLRRKVDGGGTSERSEGTWNAKNVRISYSSQPDFHLPSLFFVEIVHSQANG